MALLGVLMLAFKSRGLAIGVIVGPLLIGGIALLDLRDVSSRRVRATHARA